ncbi:MAG: nucleotidyltransferase [Clostridia bacterium]|nr:nucleotidyltransferase [Clostridia bacterium]MBQ7089509.1 nucleotidyltransferase [Clostridia bacterium]
MKDPILVIMAAGMGSRYGGLKQIDPVDPQGNIIMDFSIYDAMQAGFKKFVFVIKDAIAADFKEAIGNRIEKIAEVHYVYQELHKIPEGVIEMPADRVKPWGTGHAILCCKDVLDAPFAVINADDFYGRDAFVQLFNFLKNTEETDPMQISMVGYVLENTLTDNGHVARGVCQVSEEGYLQKIDERTMIQKIDGQAHYSEDDGKTFVPVSNTAPVSMNMWGFPLAYLRALEVKFPEFLKKTVKENPLKGEFFLPVVVDELLHDDAATVKVLHSADKWFGVTYKEDKPVVEASIRALKDAGAYPEKLWEA